jgi:type IV pilus assembly protein PilM
MVPKLLPKSFLGIDLGTSAIKIVELSAFAGRIKLENYAELPTQTFHQRQFLVPEKSTIFLPGEDIAGAIRIVLSEAKIKTRDCVIAIPDFLTFFTTFDLPKMTKEELPQAVKIEARKYIPLPLKDVTLDWQVIEKSSNLQKEKQLTILSVAVPNEIVYKCQQIAILANLKLLALEAEIFGLVRALIKKGEKLTGLIDMGARTTTCSLVEKGVLKVYHSLNISGSALTEKIARELGVEWELAEKLKRYWGISNPPPSWTSEMKAVLGEILTSSIDPILKEINKIFEHPYLKEGKEIDKIILTGGVGLMPGVLQLFQNYFKKEVELADSFSNISYPSILKENLKKIGSTFAVAVGMALRGLTK